MMGLRQMCGIVQSGLRDYKIKVIEYLQIINEINMAMQVSFLNMILALP